MSEYQKYHDSIMKKFEEGTLNSETLEKELKKVIVLGYAEGKNKMKKLYNSS